MKGILDFVKVSNNIDSLEKLEIEKGKVQIMIMKMAAITLGSIMLSVVIMMLIGLFMPNAMIDNNDLQDYWSSILDDCWCLRWCICYHDEHESF